MCTLIVVTRGWPGTPLVVAANRDERLDRPAETLRWRTLPGAPDPVLAPRDVVAGGTWLGLNRAGLFVGITNRHYEDRAPDPALRSRGELVAQALACPDVDAAMRWAEGVDASAYNGFHLVFAHAEGTAGLAWVDGEPGSQRVATRALGSGLHVATERDAGVPGGASMTTTRPARVRALLRPLLDARVFPGVDRFEAVLANRSEDDPMEAPCVRIPDRPYGTRSAMVLVHGVVPWLRWTDSAPCDGEFEERSALLQGPPARAEFDSAT